MAGSLVRIGLRLAPVLGGIGVLAWRVRETRVPVTRRSITIPPLAMSTGLGMFVVPQMRIPLWWAASALVAGAILLALPLIHSTTLELREGVVYMQRSRAFLVILLVLLAIRLALHDYIGHLISPMQTASVFFLLAFGMIVRWRLNMLRQF